MKTRLLLFLVAITALVLAILPGCSLVQYTPEEPKPPVVTPVDPPPSTPDPVPTPTPKPTPAPKLGPVLDGTRVALVAVQPDPPARLGATVNAVISHLTGCPIGSDCVIFDAPQKFMADVIRELRVRGLAAGQHEPYLSDEICTALPAAWDKKKKKYVPKVNWEGYHIYAGDGWDDPSATGKAVWYRSNLPCERGCGSYRGAFTVEEIKKDE